MSWKVHSIKLNIRFVYANTGYVYNGNINSKENNQEWFSQFSYIQQTPNIFADTIFSNITLGDEYNKQNISKY